MGTIPPEDHISPRVKGIREHLVRAQLLVSLAENQESHSAYRLRLAAIYSCRAIADLMLESAEKQEVKALNDPNPKENRKKLEEDISKKLPFYTLIEHIRIHDFHRFGITPPDPKIREVMLGGPIKLTTQKGAVAAFVTPTGLKVIARENAKATPQRSLLNEDGAFFDDQSSSYVALEEILARFLGEAPRVISDFEESVAR